MAGRADSGPFGHDRERARGVIDRGIRAALHLQMLAQEIESRRHRSGPVVRLPKRLTELEAELQPVLQQNRLGRLHHRHNEAAHGAGIIRHRSY